MHLHKYREGEKQVHAECGICALTVILYHIAAESQTLTQGTWSKSNIHAACDQLLAQNFEWFLK